MVVHIKVMYGMYDYGGEGGDSTTIVNERNDVTVMGSFNHTFDNGIELNQDYIDLKKKHITDLKNKINH